MLALFTLWGEAKVLGALREKHHNKNITEVIPSTVIEQGHHVVLDPKKK